MSERRVMVRIRCSECGDTVAWIERGGEDGARFAEVLQVDERALIVQRSASRPEHRPSERARPQVYADPRSPNIESWDLDKMIAAVTAGEIPEPAVAPPPVLAQFSARCARCYRSADWTAAELAAALDEYDRSPRKPATLRR